MRNTTFKRLLAAMLAIVMLLSLAACGNPSADNEPEKGPASTQGGNDPVETAAPTEPALGLLDPYPETVTLTFSRLLDQASTYPEGVTNDNKPSMATMALFSIVTHWNDFESGLIYMSKRENYPLMTYIQSLDVNLSMMLEDSMSPEALEKLLEVSGKNLNAAKVVVATIPLMLIYPFLQKYLIHGIVMGAVKE